MAPRYEQPMAYDEQIMAPTIPLPQEQQFVPHQQFVPEQQFVSEQQFVPQQQWAPEQNFAVDEMVSTLQEEFTSGATTMSLNTPSPPAQMGYNVPQQIPSGPSPESQGDVAEDGFEWILWNTNNQYYWRVPGSLEWTLFNV